MKIVKRGKKPEEVFEGTCGKCKSVIEARRDEINVSGEGDYRTDFKEFGTGKCPACKNPNLIFYPKSPV